MSNPAEVLRNELFAVGVRVPLAVLEQCLLKADLKLVQGQRPAVNEHLAKHGQLSKEFFTEKEGNG